MMFGLLVIVRNVSDTHIHTYMHTHRDTHTNIHTCIHTHTRTHTRTHTHISFSAYQLPNKEFIVTDAHATLRQMLDMLLVSNVCVSV